MKQGSTREKKEAVSYTGQIDNRTNGCIDELFVKKETPSYPGPGFVNDCQEYDLTVRATARAERYAPTIDVYM